MDEKQGWLEKVLDDASADVESWPSWLRDHDEQKCAPGGTQDERKAQTQEDSHRRLARGA